MTTPQDMRRLDALHLAGLEPDNLLAFMALLGLLRALDEARPEWRARAFWDIRHGAVRPLLACVEPVTEEDVATAAAEGVGTLAAGFDFGGRRDLDFSADEASTLWQRIEATGDHLAADLFAALIPDGRYAQDEIPRTPLCFLFGQGHQHFLDRLRDIPNARIPVRAGRNGRGVDFAAPARIGDALFRRWRRADMTDGFRWDSAEDRRYALRASDPSGDPAGQEYGACRLAAIGLLALPGRLVRRRSEPRYLNAMAGYDDRDIVFEWPIWTRPARLASITAMLALDAGGPVRDIEMRYRARRISVGKFFNVTIASAVDRPDLSREPSR